MSEKLESLMDYLKRVRPGPFKPCVTICPTTGDITAIWQDGGCWGDTGYEGFVLYRSFEGDRPVGIRIQMPVNDVVAPTDAT